MRAATPKIPSILVQLHGCIQHPHLPAYPSIVTRHSSGPAPEGQRQRSGQARHPGKVRFAKVLK